MKKKKLWTIKFSLVFLTTALLFSCSQSDNSKDSDSNPSKALPYYGVHGDPSVKTPMPGEIADSLIYQVPKWSLVNQDSDRVSHKAYENKIYVADFFFTSCPTICPVMSSQMARLQEKVDKTEWASEVMFLSHSVNPENDTPEILTNYAEEIGADTQTWNFVTGDRDQIYYLAKEGYFVNALPADTAPGGFIHSDQFMLIDSNRHIRGYYDGTSTEEVDKLYNDIEVLIGQAENESQ